MGKFKPGIKQYVYTLIGVFLAYFSYRQNILLDVQDYCMKEIELIRNIIYLLIFILMIFLVYLIKLRKSISPFQKSVYSYRITPKQFKENSKVLTKHHVSQLKASPEYEKIQMMKRLGQLPKITLEPHEQIILSDDSDEDSNQNINKNNHNNNSN